MKVVALAVLAALLGPAAAASQTRPVNPSLVRSAPPLDTNRINGLERMARINLDAQQRQLTEQAAETAARQERAARLSALVNQGQCRTAYDTAIAEGDRSMASRIYAACTAPAESAASQQAN